MRTHFVVAVLTTGCAVAVCLAPIASADPAAPAPDCTTVPGGTYTGTGSTECQTPGNVEIAETAPAPIEPYPWGDEFYGPAFGIVGGGDRG